MAQNDRITTDDARALSTLDIYYGILLGCTGTDLRRPGWTVVNARLDSDLMALLFGQRSLLYLVVPEPKEQEDGGARSGVAVMAPELRERVGPLLHELAPEELLTSEGLRALDEHVRAGEPAPITPAAEAHSRIRYATTSSFRPYIGQLVEWIERLDEGSESEPLALGLLARYSSVYVIRQNGRVASFAGIRPQSPYVAEVGIRTEAAPLRGHGLARAVAARATRAILAAGQLPLYRHTVDNAASEHVADALGYRLYGDSITYFTLAE